MQSMTDIAVNYKMDMELSNSNIKYGQWMKTLMVCLKFKQREWQGKKEFWGPSV